MTTPRAQYQKSQKSSNDGATVANRTIGLRAAAVLNVIVANNGATIGEIARELGIKDSQVTSSLAHLRDDAKAVRDSGIKRASQYGVDCVVWERIPEATENQTQLFEFGHTPTMQQTGSEAQTKIARSLA